MKRKPLDISKLTYKEIVKLMKDAGRIMDKQKIPKGSEDWIRLPQYMIDILNKQKEKGK